MSLSITRIEYNLDRTEPADISEKVSFWLLKPERILNGRKYRVVEGHFERLPAQSTLFKIITFVVSCCFFFLSVPAFVIGTLCAENSTSYNKCVKKHLDFLKHHPANNLKDLTRDELRLNLEALEEKLKDLDSNNISLQALQTLGMTEQIQFLFEKLNLINEKSNTQFRLLGQMVLDKK